MDSIAYYTNVRNDAVETTIKGVMPTSSGCAIFLGPEEKTFVIHVDQFIGSAISMAINGEKKERPLTHDLIGHIFQGLDVELEHIVINDVSENTFFALVHLKRNGDSMTVDARPSDAMALALRANAPILVEEAVLSKSSTSGAEPGSDEAERLRKWLESADPEELGKYEM